MIEAVLTIVMVLTLVLVSMAFVMVPWGWLLVGGLGLAILGLAIGAPAGLRYHLGLRNLLLTRGTLPRRWWLNPVRHHRDLEEEHQEAIRTPFLWGAASFVVSMFGCVAAVVALARALL